jgi:hypothetical protein
MSPINVADAATQLQEMESAANDDATREALQVLSQALKVGNISDSTGIAIGAHIRQVINRFELSPDAAAGLLDLRVMLGTRLGLEASNYQWGALLADRTRDFVGRDYVFDAIEDFMRSNSCGYLVIQGDPGLGKSSILSEYVRRTGCVAHFNVRSLGITSAAQFLQSVCSQFIADAGLGYSSLPTTATQDGAFLLKLLSEVRQGRPSSERIVIAVDALDEVDLATQPAGSNVLFLPSLVPDGVYFVLTQRNADIPLFTQAPLHVLDLMLHPAENRADITAYLQVALKRPDLHAWAVNQGLNEAEVAGTLTDLSESNFMYLRHVLPAIEGGEYRDLTVDRLPSGLQSYYEDHWRHMGMTAKPLPRIKLRIVYVLCEAKRPFSRSLLSELASDSVLQVDELAVQEVLEEWKQFLHEDIGGEHPQYSVYHSSFRDFLHRKDIVQAAGLTIEGVHGLIADKLWQTLFPEA